MNPVIQVLKKIRSAPENFKRQLHTQWPETFGHEVRGELLQFYRQDEAFSTVLSFNHFVEFFTKYEHMKIHVTVQAHDRNGQWLGKNSFQLENRGVHQVALKDLIPNLDHFGIFSVRMKITPKFVREIDYVGTLSPQFMTLFLPQDGKSAPQMIHSHKIKQGYLILSRNHIRPSSDVEILEGLQELQIFFLNSSNTKLKAGLDILDAESGKALKESRFVIKPYGIYQFQLSIAEIKTQFQVNSLNFRYFFDRSVDHKKPILFRHFENGTISCNHT